MGNSTLINTLQFPSKHFVEMDTSKSERWVRCYDPKKDKPYYVNASTRKATFKKPKGDNVVIILASMQRKTEEAKPTKFQKGAAAAEEEEEEEEEDSAAAAKPPTDTSEEVAASAKADASAVYVRRTSA